MPRDGVGLTKAEAMLVIAALPDDAIVELLQVRSPAAAGAAILTGKMDRSAAARAAGLASAAARAARTGSAQPRRTSPERPERRSAESSNVPNDVRTGGEGVGSDLGMLEMADQSGKEAGFQQNLELTGQDRVSGAASNELERRSAVVRDVQRVFECWRDLYSPRARLDAKREKRIRGHLTRGGFTADELIAAIRNAKNDPFLMGQNDTGRQYLGIETLLRDAAQVERLRDLTEPLRPRSAPVRNSGSEMTERAHRIAAEERAAAAKNGARPALALLSEFPR